MKIFHRTPKQYVNTWNFQMNKNLLQTLHVEYISYFEEEWQSCVKRREAMRVSKREREEKEKKVERAWLEPGNLRRQSLGSKYGENTFDPIPWLELGLTSLEHFPRRETV